MTALLVASMALVAGAEPMTAEDPTSAWGEFTALTPSRVLDTRHGIGTGGVADPLGPQSSIDVQITGRGGVPATGVDAVVMNVTAVAPTAWTYLTVYPTGIPLPNISNLNTTTGHTQANLATVRVGDRGKVTVYNWDGTPHVLFDVAGYYTNADGPDGARFRAIDPVRIADTRHGTGGIGTTPFGPDETRSIRATGYGGVPVTGPTAVVLNVTVDAATAWSYLTISPADVTRPNASNLNYVAGDTVANQVIVRVPPDGMIDIYNAFGTTTVIVDLVGYYQDAGSNAAGRFIAFDPYRSFDTRVDDIFPPPGDMWDGDWIHVWWDDDPFTAAVVNVTVTQTHGGGYIVTHPYPGTPPNTSTVNYGTGDTVANHAIVRCGPEMAFLNVRGNTHLIVDIFGAFTRDDPPTITSNGGGATAAVNAAENQTAVTDVQATDDGDTEGGGLTYSITGGTDRTRFSIASTTGVLTFVTAPDFENPGDADTDNRYHVHATVTDIAGGTDTQDITVTVTNVNEAPTITSNGGGATAEQSLVEELRSPARLAWATPFGGGGGAHGAGGVAVDGSGNVYTTGSFMGTLDFDPGPGTFNLTSAGYTDVFVSKLDSSGNLLWAKTLGGGGYERGNGIAVDVAGNVYTTGSFDRDTADFDPGPGTYTLPYDYAGDVFVSKLDSAGNFVWAQAIASAGRDVGFGVAVDGSGNAYVVGQRWFGAFVSKLDSAGTVLWTRIFSGHHTIVGHAVAVDGPGNVVTTGTYHGGPYDFDPGPGTFNLPYGNHGNVFISKLDTAGNFVWAKAIASDFWEEGNGVAVDGSANVYTTGYFGTTADFDPGPGTYNLTTTGTWFDDVFVLKLDAAGNFVWATRFGGIENDAGVGVHVDGSDDVYTTGSFSATGDFDPGVGTFNLTSVGSTDAFISKLDNNGNFVWAAGFGGIDDDLGLGIAADSDNIYTVGNFEGAADFDPGVGTYNLTSIGELDGFISVMELIGGLVTNVETLDEESDNGGGLTYSLTTHSGDGADNSVFTLDTATGLLNFTTPADFENPGDQDADNVYHVQVTVTDTGGLTDTQDITVTVTDVAD